MKVKSLKVKFLFIVGPLVAVIIVMAIIAGISVNRTMDRM